tara:strand:- start:497 stop:1087 length:591 start_codon:yes stop_codon:yes gene_type:complete
MEENIDSKKESEINDSKSLKKPSLIDDDQKKLLIDSKNNLTEIKKDPNKQNLNADNNNQNKPSINSEELKIQQKKEIPIEKKPFNEFVNNHLLPSLIIEIKKRGFDVDDINLKKTSRPIAGDQCWVIYCAIKDTCKFWLSFEKEDISSLKSISLCRFSQKPSVIESFLIDEKRITLKLIISRILQRLNGQKLIGIN